MFRAPEPTPKFLSGVAPENHIKFKPSSWVETLKNPEALLTQAFISKPVSAL